MAQHGQLHQQHLMMLGVMLHQMVLQLLHYLQVVDQVRKPLLKNIMVHLGQQVML
jgi:hypothetical protein